MSIAKYAITRQGYALLSSLANTDGKTFKITCAKCSDTKTYGELEEQTELAHVVHDLTIVEATNVSNISKLRLRIDNRELTEGFDLYQLGIYAKSYDGPVDPNPNDIGVLLQIWQFDTPDAIPSNTQAEAFVKDYLVTTELATATNVTINVDSAAYVTMPRFLELVDTVNYLQSNENILVNPDGVVNQLKKRYVDTTSQLDFYYHKDMWYSKSVDGKTGAKFDMYTDYNPSFLAFISATERGMQFKNVSDNDGWFTLGQIVDFNVHKRETLQERYLTLSFKAGCTGIVNLKAKLMIDDTVIESKDFVLNNTVCDFEELNVYMPKLYDGDTPRNGLRIEFDISVEHGKDFYLANVKLERSKVATKYVMQDMNIVVNQCKSKFTYQEYTIGGLQKLSGVNFRSLIQYGVQMSKTPTATIYENYTQNDDGERSFEESHKGFRYENTGTSSATTVDTTNYGLYPGSTQCYVLIGSSVAFKMIEYFLVVDARPYL